MITEKRKKGIITVFALLLAALVAGGVFSVSAKYTSKLDSTSTYVQVGLKLDPNYTGAADSEWRTVSPVSGQAMPTVMIPVRTGYIFTGYYSADGTAGHEQNDGNRYYKNDGTSYRTWDASCNVLYAGWTKVYKVSFDINGGTLLGTNPLYAMNGEKVLYSDSTVTAIVPAPSALSTEMRFDGWYTSAAGGTKVIDTDGSAADSTEYTDASGKWNLSADITLYAHYCAYMITFNAGTNNGTITGSSDTETVLWAKNGSSKLYTTKEATVEAAVPTADYEDAEHYYFDGWFTTAAGTTAKIGYVGNVLTVLSPFTGLTDDNTVLYAQFKPYTYVVTFDKNTPDGKTITGTTDDWERRYNEGASALSTNGYSGDCCSFVGWMTAADGTAKQFTDMQSVTVSDLISAGAIVSADTERTKKDITLYARWATVHTVTFVNMTSASGTEVAKYYEYDGVLYTGNSLTTHVEAMPTAGNGSRTGLSYWTTQKTGKDGTAASPLVVINGSVADGTYTDDQGKSFTVTDMSHWTLNSDITLYAVWYTVNYYKDTGRLPEGYTELEYIASTGTQYFDTEIKPDDYDTKFVIDFAMKPSSKAEGKYIYWAQEGTTAFWRHYSFSFYADGKVCWYQGTNATKLGTHDIEEGQKYNYTIITTPPGFLSLRSSINVTGSKTIDETPFGSYDNNASLKFFTGAANSRFRLYYLNIIGDDDNNANDKEWNFVPAVNGSGTVGLYDTTSNSFTSGTGGFVTEYYTQVFAYGETGNLYPAVTVTPADGLPQEQATDSYDCGYTSTTGGTLLGWSLSGDRPKTYDIGGTNAVSGKELWKSIEGTEGDLHVDLYTVWSDSRMLTSVFHSMNKNTEYYYQAPAEEETE